SSPYLPPLLRSDLQSRLQFCAHCGPQLLLFRCRQVGCFILPVDREKPNLIRVTEEVVDDAKPTTTPLPAALVGPPQLANATGAWHNVTGLRILDEERLQRLVTRIVQIR